MGIIEIILFGIGLSADAFAVSISEGLKLREKSIKHPLKCGMFFGLFQAIMPIFGFYIGDLMVRIPFLKPATAWIAFALLFFVSIKMLWETFLPEHSEGKNTISNRAELFLLAIATSIDAMTVGVTFAAKDIALIPNVIKDLNVLAASGIIGLVTFSLSVIGVYAGNIVGSRFGKRAEIAGGSILFLLSVKILLENLGIYLGF